MSFTLSLMYLQRMPWRAVFLCGDLSPAIFVLSSFSTNIFLLYLLGLPDQDISSDKCYLHLSMCPLHHHKISIFVYSCAFGLETYLFWQISYTCFSLDAICWTSLSHSLWAERGLLASPYGSCFNPSHYLRLLTGELGPLLISEDLQHQKTNVNYFLVFFSLVKFVCSFIGLGVFRDSSPLVSFVSCLNLWILAA